MTTKGRAPVRRVAPFLLLTSSVAATACAGVGDSARLAPPRTDAAAGRLVEVASDAGTAGDSSDGGQARASSADLAAVPVIDDPLALVSPTRATAQTPSMEALFSAGAVDEAALSPDGKTVVFAALLSGRANLWLTPADGSGWPRQLTFSDERQALPKWSPDGKRVAFLSDRGGDELWDIFVVDVADGRVRAVTKQDGSEEDVAWSPDGRSIAYASKPKDAPSFEIAVVDVASGVSRAITRGTPADQSNSRPIWSRDGTRIAFTREDTSMRHTDVFVVDAAGASPPARVSEHGDDVHFQAVDWTPDGGALLVQSNAGRDVMGAAMLDVRTGALRWLTDERWEGHAYALSPDGRRALLALDFDGTLEALTYDLRDGSSTRFALPRGVNHAEYLGQAFSADGRRLLLAHIGPGDPPDVWTVSSDGTRRVTDSRPAAFRSEDLVPPQLVHYPSRDGKWTISAYVYVPYNLERKPVNPAIVWIHGGPGDEYLNAFYRFMQYVATRGYVVIAPNYRGSTGHGRRFQQANLHDMGGGDLDDVVAAAQWVGRSGFVDPKKLVVMGESYGGYLSLMALTKAPEVWAAGVAWVPFVNWFTVMATEDPRAAELDRATMGDPVRDRALLRDRSPVFFADRIRAPVLLTAGDRDRGCPKSEALQIRDAIRRRGGTVELKIYENEGHGLTRVDSQVDLRKRTADFLARFVPPPGAPAPR